MELMHQVNLCMAIVQSTWDIFWVNKNKNRKQSRGVYHHNIQHQIKSPSVSRTEGGIKTLNFGMAKYI